MDILTGNELLSGASVYLDAQGRWVEDLQQARLFGPDESDAREAAIAATKKTTRIVGIEIEAIAVLDGGIVPVRLRERIRAQGPTAPHSPWGSPLDRQRLSENDHVSI